MGRAEDTSAQLENTFFNSQGGLQTKCGITAGPRRQKKSLEKKKVEKKTMA